MTTPASIDEAARILGCGRTKVFALIREGRLRSWRIGRRRMVLREDLDRLIRELAEDS